MKEPKTILITGASSGIGAALALEYAAPGIHLTLTGRNLDRLEEIERRCQDKGASLVSRVVDVTNRDVMASLIAEIDRDHPLDLVIANAGISGGTGGSAEDENKGEDETQARTIFDVNFTGTLNTIWPAIEAMKMRKRGQIAVLSSIAGMTPMPGAPAYSTSKIALKAYAEALNGALRMDGITVTAVCPGFVRSRITDQNNFPMPFFMDTPKAAHIIRRGLAKAKVSVIFPWPLAAAAWLIGRLPPGWRVALLSRMPKKG